MECRCSGVNSGVAHVVAAIKRRLALRAHPAVPVCHKSLFNVFSWGTHEQNVTIKAPAAAHAGGLGKAGNAERGVLLPCPSGCPATYPMKRR